MIYEVRCRLFLKNEGQARGLFNHVKGIFPDAVSVNPGEQNTEISFNELIENHHDENPNASCSLLAGEQTNQ